MLFGLEQEFFVYKDGNLVAVNTNLFPFDECGYLVESRSKPCSSITEAIFSLKYQNYLIEKTAKKQGYELKCIPLDTIPNKVMLEIRRKFVKGTVKYQNLYGYESHRNGKLATAGLHISFTNPVTVAVRDAQSVTVNKLFDFPRLFRYLDKQFKEEISKSKRNPGFYEIKPDGRVEYRSLPNDVDLDKLIDVVSTFNFNI